MPATRVLLSGDLPCCSKESVEGSLRVGKLSASAPILINSGCSSLREGNLNLRGSSYALYSMQVLSESMTGFPHLLIADGAAEGSTYKGAG